MIRESLSQVKKRKAWDNFATLKRMSQSSDIEFANSESFRSKRGAVKWEKKSTLSAFHSEAIHEGAESENIFVIQGEDVPMFECEVEFRIVTRMEVLCGLCLRRVRHMVALLI